MASEIRIELPKGYDEFNALLVRVDREKPAQEDVTALRAYFANEPFIAAHFGNLTTVACNAVLNTSFGAKSMRIAIEQQCESMRAGLGWDKATMLERTIIDQIVLCWLRLHDVELRYHGVMSKEHTLTLGVYWEKRLSAAQRRYLAATESLAKVRRLLRPDKSPVMAMLLQQQFTCG